MGRHTNRHAHPLIFKIFNADWNLIAILVLLAAVLILYAKQRRKCNDNKKREIKPIFRGYNKDPPESWKCKFINSHGRNQSPINLESKKATLMENCNSLRFSEAYFDTPESMTIINNGFGILLHFGFGKNAPFLYGGPLNCKYRFNIAGFKWGPNDFEGSEHTINYKRFAMELQVMHIKLGKDYCDIEAAAVDQALLFISYVFQITPDDNAYLTPIINALDKVKRPNRSCHIEAVPLCWILPPFKTGYYFYEGSMSYPPCNEGVSWIIQPEPLGISLKQLQKFRGLRAVDGPMLRNTRGVQKLHDREVYYFN